MNISAQDFITDYAQTAEQVVATYLQLSPQMQQQQQDADTVDYWCMRACEIGLGIIEATPPEFSNTGAILIIDTWSWIPPDVRAQMQAQNHPYYQAWSEVSGE